MLNSQFPRHVALGVWGEVRHWSSAAEVPGSRPIASQLTPSRLLAWLLRSIWWAVME